MTDIERLVETFKWMKSIGTIYDAEVKIDPDDPNRVLIDVHHLKPVLQATLKTPSGDVEVTLSVDDS